MFIPVFHKSTNYGAKIAHLLRQNVQLKVRRFSSDLILSDVAFNS